MKRKDGTPTSNKGGRPRALIDKKQFEQLCFLQCTQVEIAGFFHCTDDTIENWCLDTYKKRFSEVFKEYSAGGKMSVRRTQFRLAENSAAMAIWLGKQYLGQTDKVDQQVAVQGIEVVSDIPSKEDE